VARAFNRLADYLTHIKSWSDPPGSAFFLASVAAFLWFPTYTAAVYAAWVAYRECQGREGLQAQPVDASMQCCPGRVS
jgi:hypothetical protein